MPKPDNYMLGLRIAIIGIVLYLIAFITPHLVSAPTLEGNTHEDVKRFAEDSEIYATAMRTLGYLGVAGFLIAIGGLAFEIFRIRKDANELIEIEKESTFEKH